MVWYFIRVNEATCVFYAGGGEVGWPALDKTQYPCLFQNTVKHKEMCVPSKTHSGWPRCAALDETQYSCVSFEIQSNTRKCVSLLKHTAASHSKRL